MFAFFYELILFLLALFALPKMIYMRLVHGKYSTSFIKRWGKNFPIIDKKDRYLIWIHAVSLGETKVAATLVKKIKTEMNNPLILISSVTETGHQEAEKSIPLADYRVYLPFDFSWIIKPLVRKIKPNLVILCESDIWFNFLAAAKENNAPILLVNGKISERSQRRYAWCSPITHRMLTPIDLFCVQNKHYLDRFLSLEIPSSKVVITGNIKFDDTPPPVSDGQIFRNKLGFHANDLILVVGSTHDPEEKLILNALEKLWSKFPQLKVILVPRHPERFKEVSSLIENTEIPFQKYSSLDTTKEKKLVLIDAMGVLRQCYQIANIAIVGGSFTEKVGGHNILEPSWYGVPVLFGPYMHQQPEMVELMREYLSGKQISSENIEKELETLLVSSQNREIMGQAGQKMMKELQGATSKTWENIKKFIPEQYCKTLSP